MPLVVTALDAALDLPAPAAGDAEPPPTVLGRALKRVGAVADADARNVSRAQIEVRLVSDRVGPGCVVTAVGENPTPWFPNASRFREGAAAGAKRLLRKGESAVLRDGDGLGLCQSDAPPGALRFQSAGASTTLAPEALAPQTVQTVKKRNEDEDGRTHPSKRAKVSKRADVNEALTETHTTTETLHTLRRERLVALVMSGAPGAGKSSFCASLPKDDWAVVNQDTAGRGGKQGTRAQCVDAMRRALIEQKKNVAIDRCGLTPEQRETFVRTAAECDAEAHALFLDPPRDELFERLRKRTGHPTIADGGGIGVCKRMLGAKANAPPSKKEGFARVTRCVDDRDVEQARSYYRRVSSDIVVGEDRFSKIDALLGAAPVPADQNASAKPNANPASAPNAPNAFAQMMGAARASAGSSAKKTSPRASPKPSVAKTRVENGGWRLALTAMATDPAAFRKNGAVLFFDDELVVARDAYPKSRTHLLVLARDTRLAEGPKAMRSTDAALVRRMARVGEAHARRLAAEAASAADSRNDDAERFRFRCGFHASPSMRTAHMHVVSGDLRGVGMKTRRHWNSFATSFFKEAEETARDLERAEAESAGGGGASSGTRWDVAELERVVAMTPLRCHKCGDGPFPTMPKLFAHVDACVRAGFSTRTDAL